MTKNVFFSTKKKKQLEKHILFHGKAGKLYVKRGFVRVCRYHITELQKQLTKLTPRNPPLLDN